MLNNFSYYDNFMYNDIQTYKFNPTIYQSILCGNYILTPTISPYTNDHIVVISFDINKKKSNNNAISFYYNNNLILDMFEIFKNIINYDKTFTVVNNIETGSLPEVYHFHIFTNKFNLKLNDFDEFYIKKLYNDDVSNFYEIREHK